MIIKAAGAGLIVRASMRSERPEADVPGEAADICPSEPSELS